MTNPILALDPLTALQLELCQEVTPQEVLTWFVEGPPERAEQCALILARSNVDVMIAELEGTLMEKLEVQEAVYERLEQMLGDDRLSAVALDILYRSTGTRAHEVLRNRAAAQRHIA